MFGFILFEQMIQAVNSFTRENLQMAHRRILSVLSSLNFRSIEECVKKKVFTKDWGGGYHIVKMSDDKIVFYITFS